MKKPLLSNCKQKDQAHRFNAARLFLMLFLLCIGGIILYQEGDYLLSFRREPASFSASPAIMTRAMPILTEDTDKIDINQATADQLSQASGVGPALSQRILELRQERGGFHFLEELLDVNGIGEARYSALSDLFYCPLPSGRGP